MKIFPRAIALLSATAPLLAAAAPKQGEKPNVLFIAFDDLNDWVGCLGGHPNAKTPNIDKLAKDGILFTNAACSAPVCNPSRVSILTGMLPSTTGVYNNRKHMRTSSVGASVVTLPQYFKQFGYKTLRTGKIGHHLSPVDKPSWDENFPSDTKHKPLASTPEGIRSFEKEGSFKWKFGPLNMKDKETDDGMVASWAVDQLNKKHDKPFFLAVGMYHPHLPWFAPKKYFDMHPLDSIQLPKVKDDDRNDISDFAQKWDNNHGNEHHKTITSEPGMWKKKVQAYLASCSFADAQIGRVVDALKKTEYADNTIIVLWSDHGWHLGEKQHWTKFTLWEESARIPFIFAGSAIKDERRGQTTPNPVSLVDVFPTLVELCDLPKYDKNDGISLVPILNNPKMEWEQPALTTHGANNFSLRTTRWRYIRWRTGDEELYDHQNDPNEWTNLATKPEYAELKKSLAKWFPPEDTSVKLMKSGKKPARPARPKRAKKNRKKK